LISISSPLFVSPTTNTNIYTWKDENDCVHFGNRPENKYSEQIMINRSVKVSSSDNERQHFLEVFDEERKQANKTKSNEDIAKNNRQVKCDIAKNKFNIVTNSNFLYQKTDNPKTQKYCLRRN
jgi:hypothetical protein